MTEAQAFLTLNAVPGLGNATIRKLSEFFGSAVAAVQADRTALLKSGILSAKVAEQVITFVHTPFLKNEMALLERHQVHVLTYRDAAYPESLREIPDAPVVLYVRGQLQPQSMSLALVGSRRASIYGTTLAEQYAVRLAELGITIVSGLARGIDTAAHQGALKARGQTVAVLGCGLDKIYPPENAKLAAAIVERGAVISEFPMTMPPLSFNFPRRNRIISGLSLGVLVVEASHKSGALITSDFALEQGREVFAIPGNVQSPNSRGVHELIKQGAKLVQNVDDILEELAPKLRLAQKTPANDDPNLPESPQAELSPQEGSILRFLTQKPIALEALAENTQLPLGEILNAALRLELKKLIKQLPGKFFMRV